MELLLFLIFGPLITAFFMLLVRKEAERNWIVKLSALGIGAVTILLLAAFGINIAARLLKRRSL